MDVVDVILNRYSVRSYEQRPVEPEKLERVMEAARLAPSASNRQEWRFVLATDPETRARLCEAASGQKFVAQCAVVIAACAVTDGHMMRCGQPCYPIDVAIALEHIALQAVAEGLGTCWIGAFDEKAAKEVLDIPRDDSVRIVQLMTLGYPADSVRPKNRLPLEEIVMHGRWRHS